MPRVLDPHTGGVKIPQIVQERTRQRIEKYAKKKYGRQYTRLDVRFRGPLCYVDAYREPRISPGWPPEDWYETRDEMAERLRTTPVHLCRMRFFGDENHWSLAFFTYSNETYKPCVFKSGDFFGTPERAFDMGAIHLED